MTTYCNDSQVCSVCGRTIECTVLTSTNSFGSADLDLRPPEMQRSTMRAWLQECPACHYVQSNLATPTADAKEIVNSEAYRALLTADQVPELARRFVRHSLLQYRDRETAGIALLRAAWICDDSRAADQAKQYRSEAADLLLTLAPFADAEDQATIATTLVDILRRAHRFDEAASLAEQLQSYTAVQQNAVMLSVVRYQLQLCAGRDAACYSISVVS